MVCGSSAGIGRASAEALAGLGAEVTLLARNEGRLREVAAGLKTGAGQRHDWIVADTSDPAGLRAAVEKRLEEDRAAGRGAWVVLVNNTGGPKGGPIVEAKGEEFVSAITSHVLSAQALVQALLPGFKAAGYGRVINVISTSVKAPIAGLGVSNTTRAAVASWAKTLAGEVARFGVTVNNVLPGFTDTDRLAELFKAKAARMGLSQESVKAEAVASIPAGRLGRAEEVAAAVAFLATPAAGYVNGINLPVDGGRTPSL